jgi:NDP-sugar pyrophosphorylase family protein
VVRSYIGPNSKLHRTYIGDSVLEGNNNTGAGTIITNARFDRQPITYHNKKTTIDSNRCKLGCIMANRVQVGGNATIMPGTVISTESIIGPNTIVKNYVKPKSTITQSQL